MLGTIPFTYDFDTVVILKKLASVKSALAELRSSEDLLPNKSILTNTLFLQEAKESSAIESIITTHDELFQSDELNNHFSSPSAKEVYAYKEALHHGYKLLQEGGLFLSRHILEIQARIEKNKAGYRKLPGTNLRNEQTGEIIYTPPQHIDDIKKLMKNLEDFMNDSTLCDWDPLIKMAVIHHQFESIHPFYDGNGRTGRIINILYLVKEGLLKSPILYMSRYINVHKTQYYRLLQTSRETREWSTWILFMLDAIEQTAIHTIISIKGIRDIMFLHKTLIREKLPKIYGHDLLNNIFHHPYTKIDFIMRDLGVSRITATKYLEQLVEIQVLRKMKVGRDSFYVNIELYGLIKGS